MIIGKTGKHKGYPVYITCGNFTRDARNQEWAWACVGIPMFNPLGERFTNVTQSMYVRSNMLNLALLVFCLAGTGMIPAIETTTEKLNEAE